MRGATTRHDADGLSPRQRLAAVLLAQGHSNEEVAQRVGVTKQTITVYRKDPRVNDAIYRAQNEMLTQIGGKTLNSVLDAIQILRNIVADPQARDSDRIAACRTLISGTTSFNEHRALERQLNEIELMFRKYMGLPTAADASPEDDLTADYVDDPEGFDSSFDPDVIDIEVTPAALPEAD